MGRSQGQTPHVGARTLRRTAAAGVHRASPGQPARSAPPRRASERARSKLHSANRGARIRAETGVDDCHRDPQSAAGCKGVRIHRVLFYRRARRVRPDRADLHEPARGTHRSIHHREIWMTADSNAAGFRHFHDQLSSLKETLLSMSSKAEERTDIAVEALMNGDRELNRLEIEVEQAAVELLALQQPMARDLRFIIGAIKVSNDLERVGDHAVNIAESALRLADKPKVSIRIPEIEVMARRARKMLSESLDAFIRADGALGRQVCRDDDVVDSLHDSVFRVLLTHM